jgi:hypothetical protein
MPSSGMLRRVALITTDILFLHSVLRLLVTANVPSFPNLVTLMMEAIRSSETSVLTIATQHNFPEDGILHSHRLEYLKSYIALTVWALLLRRNVSYEVRTGFLYPRKRHSS